MKTRKLGELTVSALGLGCMSMSQAYGAADRESPNTINSGVLINFTPIFLL